MAGGGDVVNVVSTTNDAFILTNANWATSGYTIANDERGVLIIAKDTDDQNGYDTFDVYYVQDVDAGRLISRSRSIWSAPSTRRPISVSPRLTLPTSCVIERAASRCLRGGGPAKPIGFEPPPLTRRRGFFFDELKCELAGKGAVPAMTPHPPEPKFQRLEPE